MKPTRARTLALVAILAAAVTWALLHAVYASLPPLTWTGVPALLIAAGIEAWTGRDLRARIRGNRGARPAPPLFVARIVALAKASSYTAALLAGVCAGFMIYLSGMASAPTPRDDLIDASLSFGACLVLLAAALFLEYCCRVPEDPDKDQDTPSVPFPHLLNHDREDFVFSRRLRGSSRAGSCGWSTVPGAARGSACPWPCPRPGCVRSG